MNEPAASRLSSSAVHRDSSTLRRWTDVAGAWLGVGTSPGALLIGAGIAQRYQGPVPYLSILVSFTLIFLLIWFQGQVGLAPPLGEGANLTQITSRYFGAAMQRVVAALIALGMIGWFGFNVGLGGAALSSLLRLPEWLGPLLIGLPVLVLSFRGLKSWNFLAALTTLAVLVLVVLVVARLAGRQFPVSTAFGTPTALFTDVAVFIGYISVFSVRAPDFTANLETRRDLLFSDLLLCLPLILVVLAGVALQQGTGSADVVGILAAPGGLAVGNLLIAAAVIAPTFTTLYSGAPALRASVGLSENASMLLITLIGLTLAIARFDLQLIPWVVVLAAMLPPLVIPLAVEFARRRQARVARLIPLWVWLPGALVSMGLTFLEYPLASLAGFAVSALVTVVWYMRF